jgi:nucleotide-binding universal stress UspA family protein
MYRHILIPTDGSELAHRAVSHGLSLAKLVGAKVTALTVEGSFNVYAVPTSKDYEISGAFAGHIEQAKAHAGKILNGVAEEARAAGVICETVQIEGVICETVQIKQDQPYKAIIETAEQRDCDLIVMASHGRSGIAAIVLGSVTTKVLTHTKIPVLVCH